MRTKGRLVATEVAIELAKVLGPLLVELKAKDRELADQAKRAITSVALNLAEGERSLGGNRRKHFWIASGSRNELEVALRLAHALGELSDAQLALVWPLLDRLGALVWGLTHPRE